jgi:hypothetical protein
MLTFNNEKWDFWAAKIAQLINLAVNRVPEETQALLDERAMVIISILKILMENAGQPIPLDKFTGLAVSDVGILMMIVNHHFNGVRMTYTAEGLQISKDVLEVVM